MIREIDDEMYRVLLDWWEVHRWSLLPRESLPSGGYVSVLNGKPVVAGFLYTTNSDLAWLEWIISNPVSTPEERTEGLRELLETIDQRAREKGCKSIFTATKHPRLMERLEEHGFAKTDTDMTHFVKTL